jgi:DNA-binding beta-propeller fold protein YncE
MRRAPAWAAAVALGGCGSAEQLPPAPEPARSPPARHPPAGRVLTLPGGPEGIAVDGRTGLVAVGLRRPPRVVLLDADTGRLVRRVPLPGAPRHLHLVRAGGPLLVPAEGADVLVQVSLPGGRARTTPVGRFPHDATAEAGRVFVGNEFGDSLTVVEDGRAVRTLPAPVQPGGVAGVRGRVGVVGVRERAIRLYDARTLRSLGTEHAGVGSTHVVADRSQRLYVVDTEGDALLDFRTKPRLRLAWRTNLAGRPYGIAIDPARRRLWVTLTERNELARLRIARVGEPRVVARYPTVRQPNSVAVDEGDGSVYVAGRGGRLQILHPEDGRGLAGR